MKFLDIVKRRYACKGFDEKKIPDDHLKTILEAGRLAPTAKNLQEQKIYVAQSEKALGKIDSETPCRYGAPTVLVVAFDKDNTFTYPGGKHDSGKEDAAIVASHMILAAASLDIDSCWVNAFDPDKMAKALNLKPNKEILCLIDLGYAKEGVGPLDNHFDRKDLDETVKFI